MVRDLGNNALYADTAHRVAIDQGWIPGPTLVNSGLIIGGLGGQFWPTPEMAKQHGIVYPEYRDADTPDEIVKKLNAEINAGLADPKIKQRFTEMGVLILGGSPEAFGKMIADETEKWGKAVKFANVRAD